MGTTLPGGAARSLEELVAYEGLRVGSVRAMRGLLDAHHADMVRLARLYLPDDAEGLVARTWDVALGGLGTFVWHTTFRAWLFGILADLGRGEAHRRGRTDAARPVPTADGRLLAAPDTVATQALEGAAALPWTGWWTPDSWTGLQAWVDAQPQAAQEVVVLVDVLGWTPADARDALGWTDATMLALHRGTHEALAARLSAEGVDLPAADVGALLAQLPTAPIAPPSPALVEAFRRWRRLRGLTVHRRMAGWLRVRRLGPPAVIGV